MSVCPTCGVDDRCEEVAPNGMRCDQPRSHRLPHRYYTGGDYAYRWGAVEKGCFDPQCNREPGHPMPHRDGKGTSWAPDDAIAPASVQSEADS